MDHNSPEAVAARANQEDPIVMYLIVRESLGMSIGKTAAQVGHAVGMLHLKYSEFEAMNTAGWLDGKNTTYYRDFEAWLSGSFRKVVLSADEKEWAKLKAELPLDDFVMVTDAGLTEISAGSDTVIGVMPMYKSQCPKVIKRLQVLK